MYYNLTVRRVSRCHLPLRGLATTTKKDKKDPPPKEPTLNCAKAVIKAHERESFTRLLPTNVTTLQGIGPVHQEQLKKLRIQTVADLANYKFFHLARAITCLAQTEEQADGGRLPETAMNINKGVDKAYENLTFHEIAQAPVAALQGISEQAGETWAHMGVKTVQDLGTWKYCEWAEAIQTASKYEQDLSIDGNDNKE